VRIFAHPFSYNNNFRTGLVCGNGSAQTSRPRCVYIVNILP